METLNYVILDGVSKIQEKGMKYNLFNSYETKIMIQLQLTGNYFELLLLIFTNYENFMNDNKC